MILIPLIDTTPWEQQATEAQQEDCKIYNSAPGIKNI